jgi:hypothetical protein
MPSCKAIRDYWADQGIWERKGYESKWEFYEGIDDARDKGCCFACGVSWGVTLERAHILAHMEGGMDTVENLHLLCQHCHKDSEIFSGEVYWEWFWNRDSWHITLIHVLRWGVGGQELLQKMRQVFIDHATHSAQNMMTNQLLCKFMEEAVMKLIPTEAAD